MYIILLESLNFKYKFYKTCEFCFWIPIIDTCDTVKKNNFYNVGIIIFIKHVYCSLNPWTNLVCANFVSSITISCNSVSTHDYSRDAARAHQCSYCAVTHQRWRDLIMDQLVCSQPCTLHVRACFRAVDMLWTTRQ